ncbi:MAG: tetratricopeptide repeat protein [Treponema sp.]|nr:tetratricopeptide repeat protein [Treponema sp.]
MPRTIVLFTAKILFGLFAVICMAGCDSATSFSETQQQLYDILEQQELPPESRYTIINRIANNLLAAKEYNQLIIFLTSYVEENPDDTYNAYWLLITAYVYMQLEAKPMAEYYFDRIINTCQDLEVQGQSIHFLCLQNLIQISQNSTHRISYFTEIINRFPQLVNTTELYYRLAVEYENEGEWDLALKSYSNFLAQEDASSIQITGEPNAYTNAQRLVDFNDSPKDWTFESLEALEKAVKQAITNYNYKSLDKYKSKVNFFAMSWRQDMYDTNSQEDFSMQGFMRGNRIRYNAELDEASNPNEAYLRTWGWNNYVSVWYLYFRKVNFPIDPEIHGRWEWAGIYYGEML